jgi:transcriptional regulator with XRE-family HTH domain
MLRRSAKHGARTVIGANLRRLRKSKGLSQETLADLAGIHRTYVGCVERSEKNISIDSLERLAKALNVEVGALVTREAE